MFGVKDEFDIVIGNPPYVQLQNNKGRLRKLYQDEGYATLASTGDLYQLFYERGCGLLKRECGLLCYITSNSWINALYGAKTRKFFNDQHRIVRLLEMGKDVFDKVIVDTAILLLQEGHSKQAGLAVDMDRIKDNAFPPKEHLWSPFRPSEVGPWLVLPRLEQSVMGKLVGPGTPLREWGLCIRFGVENGL